MVTVRDLLGRFGPLTKVREALAEAGVANPPTIQVISAWQVARRIPLSWQKPILEAAKLRGIDLTERELIDSTDAPEAAREPGEAA